MGEEQVPRRNVTDLKGNRKYFRIKNSRKLTEIYNIIYFLLLQANCLLDGSFQVGLKC